MYMLRVFCIATRSIKSERQMFTNYCSSSVLTLIDCLVPGLITPPDGMIVIGWLPLYLILNSPVNDPSLVTKTSCIKTLPSATVTPKSAGPLSSNCGEGVYLWRIQTKNCLIFL